jgi:uncharacterized membrane protein
MALTSGVHVTSLAGTNRSQFGPQEASPATARPRVNVGKVERQISMAAGAASTILGVARRDVPGMLLAALGAGLIYRGASGHCSVYNALGIDARGDRDTESEPRTVRIVESFLVDKPIEELYTFWRGLENLPTIMSHLKSVQVIDERRSHWVAKAPIIAGGSVEWDAEIIEDRPNERIAWQSLADADVENHGSVEFKRAPGDRGTVVRVKMEYAPPAGRVGGWFAKLFAENPESQIREDLRRFKRVMEIGESLTIEGQPRGACLGGIGRWMS